MQIEPLHSWDLSPSEARRLQVELAEQVDTTTPLEAWGIVAAADVSSEPRGDGLWAAVVVVRTDTFEVIERVGVAGRAPFPYVPGLLSFREAPLLLDAFARLQTLPDAVMCDGQGIAHPRGLGIASHLGLWLRLPTIGVAKSRLFGTHDEPGPNRGDWSPLLSHGRTIGAVLRTRPRVNPLYISAGHLCDLPSAIALTLATLGNVRLPIPSRMAHEYVNEVRRASGKPAE